MNTLLASIKFDQVPEVGDDLSAKVYRVDPNQLDIGNEYAVSLFCNDELQQCLDNFVSYEAACRFAFDWLRSGVEE